jgi:hypothetical protein
MSEIVSMCGGRFMLKNIEWYHFINFASITIVLGYSLEPAKPFSDKSKQAKKEKRKQGYPQQHSHRPHFEQSLILEKKVKARILRRDALDLIYALGSNHVPYMKVSLFIWLVVQICCSLTLT